MPRIVETNMDKELSENETFSDALDNLVLAEKDIKNQRINSPLQELSASDLEYSMLIRQRYGLVKGDLIELKEGIVSNGEEWSILLTNLDKICKRILDDLIMGRGGCVEEGHVLLMPILSLLEVILLHRFKKNQHELWGSIQKSTDKIEDRDEKELLSSVIENVKAFTLLRTGMAKMRVWIRLSLMNKSFPTFINHLGANFRYSRI
jgi:hypothetical protein